MQAHQKRGLNDARHVAIQEVNQYRETQGLHPLNGDPRIHEEAQRYSETVAKTSVFKPAGTYKYTERLATSFKRDKVEAVQEVLKKWFDGNLQYHGFDRVTKMGIGIAWNEVNENYVVVAYFEKDQD